MVNDVVSAIRSGTAQNAIWLPPPVRSCVSGQRLFDLKGR